MGSSLRETESSLRTHSREIHHRLRIAVIKTSISVYIIIRIIIYPIVLCFRRFLFSKAARKRFHLSRPSSWLSVKEWSGHPVIGGGGGVHGSEEAGRDRGQHQRWALRSAHSLLQLHERDMTVLKYFRNSVSILALIRRSSRTFLSLPSFPFMTIKWKASMHYGRQDGDFISHAANDTKPSCHHVLDGGGGVPKSGPDTSKENNLGLNSPIKSSDGSENDHERKVK